MRLAGSTKFDWDVHNIRHLARHGVTPEEFEQAVSNDPEIIEVEEERGEERWSAVGPTNGIRMLYMVFTCRGGRIRAISAWDAPKALWEQYFKDRGV